MTLSQNEQHRWLMQGLESLMAICDHLGIAAWLDWGTLLGYARHRNVIPWDYDADLCLLEDDYTQLLAWFELHGEVDGLRMCPDYYEDAAGCCAVLIAGCPDPWLGFDLVAYRVEGKAVPHLMSERTVQGYPGQYHLTTEVVFPMHRGWFLGRRAWLPAQPEARIVEVFGEQWRDYPDGHQASRFTAPVLWEIPVHPPDEPPAGTPHILRSAMDLRGQGYASPRRLSSVRSGAWRKETRGIELVRVLASETVATLQARGIDPRQALAGSFSDSVWRDDQALWGQIGVGYLEHGDTLVIPDGSVVRSEYEVTPARQVRAPAPEPTCRQ